MHSKPINFVCKYDLRLNKTKVFTDRKKALKRGYIKHKGELHTMISDLCLK